MDLTINGEPVAPSQARALIESAVTLVEAEAVGRHQTAVDTESDWDGPGQVAQAEGRAQLRHMHAAFRGGDPDEKGQYALPHHAAGTDTAANISGVNNALARLGQTQGIDGARDGAEAHLRGHRRDAGLEESMSEHEARQAARDTQLVEAAVVAAETGVLSEAGSLREASAESGHAVIRVIEAGQGSSGMYPAETLQEAANQRVFHAGTPMFLDHPSMSEEYERPERSVRDLAGRLTSDARYEDGALVAEAEIFPHWRDLIAGLHEHIGVSIRADGRIDESGTVREISRARSVDYVTEAGAGGRVQELVESARNRPLAEARNAGQWLESRLHLQFTQMTDMLAADGHITREERIALSGAIGDALNAFNERVGEDAPQLYDRDPFGAPDGAEQPEAGMPESTTTDAPKGPTTEEGHAMSESTAPADGAQTETDPISEAATEQSVTALQEKVAKLEREQAERDARDQVRTIVREAVDLPEAARDRVVAQVDLTSDDLAEATKQTLDAERRYIAAVASSRGVGRVSGMGEAHQPTETGPRTPEDYQKLGLSEADAKAAARIYT